jgi:deoxyadenosine/deoxycytidine kinase
MKNIYVEGNIGTGKTTFLKYLEQHLPSDKYNFIYEPVDEWMRTTDDSGKSILEHFYEDQSKWSYCFQMNSFISRIHKITETNRANPGKINIIERSVFTDDICFAKNCLESGDMQSLEYNVYKKWHTWLTDKFDIQSDAFIYLYSSPEVCSQRIAMRSRSGEAGIPIEYLENLHRRHDEWLNTEKNVLKIESEENMYDNESKMKNIIERIEKLY